MIESPSVWPLGAWVALISSPLKWMVRLWPKVITGRPAGRQRRHLAAHDRLLGREPLAHVLVRDDQRLEPEDLVPAGVIEVPVGVEQELEVPLVDRGEGGLDLVGERGELIVDDQ